MQIDQPFLELNVYYTRTYITFSQIALAPSLWFVKRSLVCRCLGESSANVN